MIKMNYDLFTGTNVLITGGAGFVGSNLTKRLLSLKTNQITIVDNLLSAEKENLPDVSSINFIEGSIASDQVLDQIIDKFDYIFHLATYHGNQNSIYDPIADHDNNLFTTLKLLERIKSFKRVKKIVYSGAGCAVAKKTFKRALSTKENAPISVEMDSPYSISKIVGEFYMVYYHNRQNTPTVRARFQNVYGPGEILGAGKWRGTSATVWRNVIPTFIYKAIQGQPLPLEGGGETSRDFIFVDDIVDGLLHCAALGRAGDVYNLSSGIETRISELAQKINEITGNPAGIIVLPQRKWDKSGHRFGDPFKAKLEIGFQAQVELMVGLKKTIEWTKQNIDLINSCIGKHKKHLDLSSL
jgi:UDP-glucose 4-epimerase